MAESTVTADSKLTSSDTRRRIWAIVGASSGNLVEWFDFYVYSFCSLYFAHIFFPSGNTTTQLLQTAGVFAAGFLMRPIGGWLFGRIADKHGRKKSMLLSVCMMCFGSLVIACLPGYCVFRSIRSRIGIEVRSAIRIHSINRELNFFYRFLTRFFAAFHYRGIFPQ